MEEKNQASAIDAIVRRHPRLKSAIWKKPGSELASPQGLSGGERALYEVCVSIWNGDAKVNLYELMNELGDEDFKNVVEGLLVARFGPAGAAKFQLSYT